MCTACGRVWVQIFKNLTWWNMYSACVKSRIQFPEQQHSRYNSCPNSHFRWLTHPETSLPELISVHFPLWGDGDWKSSRHWFLQGLFHGSTDHTILESTVGKEVSVEKRQGRGCSGTVLLLSTERWEWVQSCGFGSRFQRTKRSGNRLNYYIYP